MYALVEHFLNKEGTICFPLLLKEITEKLKEFPGFISLEQLEEKKDTNRSILLLKFESAEDLKTWASSKEHKWFLEQLTPFMVRNYDATLFKIV